MGAELSNDVRRRREALGLSQRELAGLVGVSRQAIVAIEGGRQVPATTVSLRLAHALGCAVHDLFRLKDAEGLAARLAPPAVSPGSIPGSAAGDRVTLSEVRGAWVAHRLPGDGTVPADGIVTSRAAGDSATVRPLDDPRVLEVNVLVSGCAPILGMLARRVGSRFADAHATWLPGGSGRALDLLESGLVHVAGVHLSGPDAEDDHEAVVRSRFSDDRMLIVNLTRWREGFVVPAGNPTHISSGEDLLREGIRFARREHGSGAQRLLERVLADAGARGSALGGPEAGGHVEVAQLVRSGAADVGVAIEGVALAAGLGFVPLVEERFDLVMYATEADRGPVRRLVEVIGDPAFRADLGRLPGYDTEQSGHASVLEAA